MLSQSCDTITGVGPTLAAKLAKCGIHTLQDLLFHLPFRYQDRTRITPIQDLRPNDWCVVVGQICKTQVKYGKRATLTCLIEDKTGVLTLRFFHFNKQQIQAFKDKSIRVFGEVRAFGNGFEMIHPEYQLLDVDEPCHVEEKLTPIYPSTQGLSQTRLRQIIQQAFTLCHKDIAALEWMKDELLHHHKMPSIFSALAQLHQPPPDVSLQALENGSHPAIRRLAFEELLAQHLSMKFARAARNTRQSLKIPIQSELLTRFFNHLPFTLTNAQKRVLKDIQHDLNDSKPMLRLVQGDVGSGKTVISALAALQAIAQGHQVALMAPTDLLSEQHANTLASWFLPLDIPIHRLTGKMKTKERKETLDALKHHQCHFVIGTHALFQEEVVFAQLGLVIIDEQHRFGVEQRLALQDKGNQAHCVPHQLFMTATPIPRTLAMTQFAHMDVSTIDELPPGRTPVVTAVLNQAKHQAIITRLQAAIESGRQAYWVCTLIEDSEKLQCMAAIERARSLQEQLPNLRVGLVHGKMTFAQKETTMLAFKQGNIHLLVATTVIEVGVDVPNASLMIIENAERLGLSQLHQLRGRIGRGSIQSHCMLLYQTPLSKLGQARLQIMRDTTDGFIIAEKDLALRGAGEILGTRQTGYRPYKVAVLERDKHLLDSILPIAEKLIATNPTLAHAITTRWLGEYTPFLCA